MDDEGRVVHPEREPKLTGDELRRLFRAITLQRILDERMLWEQRKGQMGFYLSCIGEEAVPYGTAHALRDSDWIFTAYRETGAALYRGYPLRTFMCQLFGNAEDPVKGRQMPVHHSVRSLNFVSISSPVGSQIPHAVGRGVGRQAPEEGRRRGRLLRRGRDVDADLPRQRELRGGVQDPGHPDVPQQRLGDLGAALGADGVADVRAEGDRLRDAGRARRRQRHPGDDPRRRRGGRARAAGRGRRR